MARSRVARVLGLVVVLVAGAGSSDRACCAGEATGVGGLARMQGRWTTRAGERRDLRVSIEIRGSEVSVEVETPQGAKLEARGEVRVNDKVTPATLDWVGFTSADTIELPEIPAIYELSGGRLTVCNGGPNNPRPTQFKRGSGVLADLHVFERVRPAENPASASPGDGVRR